MPCAFHAIHPLAYAMRFSDCLPWEGGEGTHEVNCPEGFVVYRLKRLRE